MACSVLGEVGRSLQEEAKNNIPVGHESTRAETNILVGIYFQCIFKVFLTV